MKKRDFYLTLTFFLICLVGIGLAIREINTIEPESEEGALMDYTCEEVKNYETIAAEQDLETLKQLMIDHINGYATDPEGRLSAAMGKLDSLRDEVAFHNTDQQLYRSQFSEILRLISRAELVKAQGSLSRGETEGAVQAVEHARHCLHDAMMFAGESQLETDRVLLQKLNMAKSEGLTKARLEVVIGEL